MEATVREALVTFLRSKTSFGLYPLVAYDLNGDDVTLLTTNIPDLPLAIRVLEEVTKRDYDLGSYTPGNTLEWITSQNPHLFRRHPGPIPGLSALDKPEVGRLISCFGAPHYRQKAFLLVDICGFSQLNYAEQLSQLYSLNNIFSQGVYRARTFSTALGLPNRFARASTGDGFYSWHSAVGGNADVATFMLLLCLLERSEALRSEGFPMRLKASFMISSAFLLYETTDAHNTDPRAVNAVGAATNGAARLLEAARPGQILIGDFARQGQGTEKMTPASLVRQANELFRTEGLGVGSLQLAPERLLRYLDKHGDAWYSWNVVGRVPTYGGGTETIGIQPDTAQDICEVNFRG